MKYCTKCGKQLVDEAAFCVGCGCAVESPAGAFAFQNASAQPKPVSGLKVAAKVLMIISTVVMGLYLIPLAWCIPMTITYSNSIKNNKPISTGFKVCTLLFVNMIAGILMLCDNEN